MSNATQTRSPGPAPHPLRAFEPEPLAGLAGNRVFHFRTFRDFVSMRRRFSRAQEIRMPGFGPTLTYYSTLALRPDPPLSFAWNQDRRIWSELLSRCGCAPPL